MLMPTARPFRAEALPWLRRAATCTGRPRRRRRRPGPVAVGAAASRPVRRSRRHLASRHPGSRHRAHQHPAPRPEPGAPTCRHPMRRSRSADACPGSGGRNDEVLDLISADRLPSAGNGRAPGQRLGTGDPLEQLKILLSTTPTHTGENREDRRPALHRRMVAIDPREVAQPRDLRRPELGRGGRAPPRVGIAKRCGREGGVHVAPHLRHPIGARVH